MSLSRDALVQLANKCPHSVTMSTKEYFRNDGNYIRVLKVQMLLDDDIDSVIGKFYSYTPFILGDQSGLNDYITS